MSEFTHVDGQGRARMVDVSDKEPSRRVATATATVVIQPDVVARIRDHQVAKGPVLEAARLAGIGAAKQTWALIPLCHPLPLDSVDVAFHVEPDRIHVEATARVHARTGVEMEALTAASVAALTIYDMCKALDRAMTITDVALLEKSGGRSGTYRRDA